MPKPNLIKQFAFNPLRIAVVVLAVAGLIGGATIAHADQFDEQINQLRQQNAGAQSALTGLQAQASSYQDAISKLQAQISGLQQQIATNQQQQAVLQQQIADAQAKIDEQKKYLGADLQSMYENGQLSTIEELATSRNLSDYVDQEEYRMSVQGKVNELIAQIAAMQAKLQRQKTQLDTLTAGLQEQNNQLAAAQSQQQQLLSYNQQQQSDYNGQIAANSSKIADLRRQQAILNARYNIGDFKGDPGNGGYPSAWANAPQDSVIDSWGMYNRECVSYTAFKVHQDFLAGKDSHDMPWWGGKGNANQWDDNARAAGIPVDSNPTVGSIAISNAGYYGHAMYVAAVNGDQIYVQQFNASLNGTYSEGWRYATGLVFLHF